MFLCSKCHDPECVHFSGSHGRCEGCGRTADCVDCQAYKTKRSKPKMTDKNGNPLKKKPKGKVAKLRAALTQVKVDHLNKRIKLPVKTHALIENTLNETKSLTQRHPTSEAERLLLKEYPDDDHTECNHGVGHCQYSVMFEVLFKAERQRQYEAKKNAVCDGCGRKGGDIKSCGKDANGDPDAPDLCFLCRTKAEREFGYRTKARRK